MKHKLLILSIIFCLLPITAFSSDWTPMSSGTTESLLSVWGSSGSDVFAVGYYGTILHYDGSRWSSMLSGTTNNLSAVWGSSGTDVFAVGNSGTILHYDGSSWTAMASGTTYWLQDIWGSSATDVFAVGYRSLYPYYSTIFHYNGNTWDAMHNTTLVPLAVWGSSGNDVFAVGWSNTGYPYDDTIYHYNGSIWSAMYAPTDETLYDVWGSSSRNVFAVGWDGTILHYNGSTWSSMASPVAVEVEVLSGIWGSSATDVFAVGTGLSPFYGIIFHYNGKEWSSMTSGTTNDLADVWGSSGSNVFAVGGGGTILHYAGSPTAISLSSFNATPKAGNVIIQWSTESEIDNVGFNLYRAETEGGNYIKLNTSLIPAQGTSIEDATYEFIDSGLRNGRTYYYRLEDINLHGTSTIHGTISATPRFIFWLRK